MDINVIHDDTKQPVPTRVIDNLDGTFSVEVIPPASGTYTTNMTYGGLKVPYAPQVFIKPSVDVSKIKVDGLESSKLLIQLIHTLFIESHHNNTFIVK